MGEPLEDDEKYTKKFKKEFQTKEIKCLSCGKFIIKMHEGMFVCGDCKKSGPWRDGAYGI